MYYYCICIILNNKYDFPGRRASSDHCPEMWGGVEEIQDIPSDDVSIVRSLRSDLLLVVAGSIFGATATFVFGRIKNK